MTKAYAKPHETWLFDAHAIDTRSHCFDSDLHLHLQSQETSPPAYAVSTERPAKDGTPYHLGNIARSDVTC